MMPLVSDNTALLLDIDGTLLDLARTPDSVKVPKDLVRALEALTRRLSGALAFVSGRNLDSIDRLFLPFRPAAIGAHGAEMRGVDGSISRDQPLSDSVRQVFAGLANNIPGLLLEDKKSTLALHYRLAPEALPVLNSAMGKYAKLFEAEKLQILHGKAVIELRRQGVDKGSAVANLVRQQPFAGRTILFGGDDATDEDVFRILPRLGGHGFSVGRKFPGAEHHFKSPRAVRDWLTGAAQARLEIR